MKTKMEFSAVIACIETTLRKNGTLKTLKYRLIQTEDKYIITTTNNYNEELKIEDIILFESKHQLTAVKMFAHIATNDIEQYYKIHAIKIKR